MLKNQENISYRKKFFRKFLLGVSFATGRLGIPSAKSPERVLPKSAIHDVRYSVVAD